MGIATLSFDAFKMNGFEKTPFHQQLGKTKDDLEYFYRCLQMGLKQPIIHCECLHLRYLEWGYRCS